MRIQAMLSNDVVHEPLVHRFSEVPHVQNAIFFLKMSKTMGRVGQAEAPVCS